MAISCEAWAGSNHASRRGEFRMSSQVLFKWYYHASNNHLHNQCNKIFEVMTKKFIPVHKTHSSLLSHRFTQSMECKEVCSLCMEVQQTTKTYSSTLVTINEQPVSSIIQANGNLSQIFTTRKRSDQEKQTNSHSVVSKD